MQLFAPTQNVRDALDFRRQVAEYAAQVNSTVAPETVSAADVKKVQKSVDKFILMHVAGNLSNAGIYGIFLANTVLFVRDGTALSPGVLLFDMLLVAATLAASNSRIKSVRDMHMSFEEIKDQVWQKKSELRQNQK